MKRFKQVIITRISGSTREHVDVNYEVEGTLMLDVRIGEPIWLDRFRRNDVVVDGVFKTTPVKTIELSRSLNIITTESGSEYLLTEVK